MHANSVYIFCSKAFRCAYCFYWNPARKQKPAPPKLENISPRVSVAEMSRRMLEKEEAESSSSSEGEELEEEDEEETGKVQSQLLKTLFEIATD